MNSSDRVFRGPSVYENWRAFSPHLELRESFEFPLFTDAWITGGPVAVGPYLFFNTIAHAGMPQDALKPALFVRVENNLESERPRMDATDTGSYHGGNITDEIAALTSLSLRIRLKSGAITRRFTPDDRDPRGTPVAYGGFGEPTLIKGDSSRMLPTAMGPHSLDDLESLAQLPRISRSASIAIVRAARLYQESIWLCESEPAIAWLLMVSAVECGAHHWSENRESPVERMRGSKPRLTSLIEQHCPDLLEEFANEIAGSLGATQKFIKFLLHFLPDAPVRRPPDAFQLRLTKSGLRPVLSKVYEYRSKALHAGVPFPAPMCIPPHLMISGWEAPEERPLGLATSALGGVWLADDAPIHFHLFEHLARGALLNWWRDLASDDSGAPEQNGR
jgi:hypothetical protein